MTLPDLVEGGGVPRLTTKAVREGLRVMVAVPHPGRRLPEGQARLVEEGAEARVDGAAPDAAPQVVRAPALPPLIARVPAPLGDISHQEVSVVRGRSDEAETLVPKRVLGQGLKELIPSGNACNTPVSSGNASGGGGQNVVRQFWGHRAVQRAGQQRFVRRAVGW